MTVVVVFDRSNRTAFIERAINDFALPAAEESGEYPQSSRIEINLGGPLAGDLQEQDGRKEDEHDDQTGRVLWRCDCPRVASYEGPDREEGAMKPAKTMVRNLGLPEAKVSVWPESELMIFGHGGETQSKFSS